MKHKIHFSGCAVNLDQAADIVQEELQAAVDQFYPKNLGITVAYKEAKPDTCEIAVSRRYIERKGHGIQGMLNSHDMSLISGCDLSAFSPWNQKAFDMRYTTWYDGMVYSYEGDFITIWKQMNQAMVSEKMKKVSIDNLIDKLVITIKY